MNTINFYHFPLRKLKRYREGEGATVKCFNYIYSHSSHKHDYSEEHFLKVTRLWISPAYLPTRANVKDRMKPTHVPAKYFCMLSIIPRDGVRKLRTAGWSRVWRAGCAEI